jgi:hypothetical protein
MPSSRPKPAANSGGADGLGWVNAASSGKVKEVVSDRFPKRAGFLVWGFLTFHGSIFKMLRTSEGEYRPAISAAAWRNSSGIGWRAYLRVSRQPPAVF